MDRSAIAGEAPREQVRGSGATKAFMRAWKQGNSYWDTMRAQQETNPRRPGRGVQPVVKMDAVDRVFAGVRPLRLCQGNRATEPG